MQLIINGSFTLAKFVSKIFSNSDKRPSCKSHVTVTIVLALATLGNMIQIDMILIAKASKEGNIESIFAYKPRQCK